MTSEERELAVQILEALGKIKRNIVSGEGTLWSVREMELLGVLVALLGIEWRSLPVKEDGDIRKDQLLEACVERVANLGVNLARLEKELHRLGIEIAYEDEDEVEEGADENVRSDLPN